MLKGAFNERPLFAHILYIGVVVPILVIRWATVKLEGALR